MDENKLMLVSEIISAAEHMAIKDLDIATVCKIDVMRGNKIQTKINMSITMKEFIEDMENLLNWTVEVEEYELSHRIKLLSEYLEKNDKRGKVEATKGGTEERNFKPFWN